MTNTPSDTLLPCPFCGGEATHSLGAGERLYRTVGCNNDDCDMPRMWWEREDKSEAEAITAWNTRHKQPVDALVGALQTIVICAWSDEFKNADTKLDAIDKVATEALSAMPQQPMGSVAQFAQSGDSHEMRVELAPDSTNIKATLDDPVLVEEVGDAIHNMGCLIYKSHDHMIVEQAKAAIDVIKKRIGV